MRVSQKIMRNRKIGILGVPVGVINILLGAGGGILAVPILKKCGLDQKEAQANAVAVILPLTFVSFLLYARGQYVYFAENAWILPLSAFGAILGATIFKKLSPRFLRKLFAVFMIWAGVRMLWKL